MTINPTSASRRAALKAALSVVGAGTLAAAAQTARAQEKLAQTLVQYQESPKDGNECDACINWQPPNGCSLVSGTINPKGWCVAFAPKDQ